MILRPRSLEINDPACGRLLPGTKIVPYYDRTNLLHLTTETVTENLCLGVALVVAILFMFVNNIRTAIIVAINIPLALLFAFTVLFLRGKSANLLSIGAVDFGIIVDSSVVVVENVYRNLASGNHPGLPLKERIKLFVHEIDHALLFSILIMVCAFVPLFAMSGAEGQLFRPMAQTYAFSLAGALVLSMTLSPVLCMLLFKHFKPVRENMLVRALKFRYLWKLKLCLRYPKTTCVVMAFLIGGTFCLIPQLGREFMPELEEGNLWLRGIGELNMNLEHSVRDRQAGAGHHGRLPRGGVDHHPERPARRRHGHGGLLQRRVFRAAKAAGRLAQGRAGDGLAAVDLWSAARRTKRELVNAMNADLERDIPGVTWNFLAEHPRQRAGSDVRGEGGQFPQDLRPGHRPARASGDQGQAHLARHPGRRQRGHLPRPRRDAPPVPRRSAQVPEVGRDHGRRQQRRHHRDGRPAPVHHGRRREAVQHLRPLAQVAAERRDVDPGHPGRHHQQPGGPAAGIELHAVRGRARPAAARCWGQPGRHVQPDFEHAANPAPRPGHAGGQEPRPRSRRLVH